LASLPFLLLSPRPPLHRPKLNDNLKPIPRLPKNNWVANTGDVGCWKLILFFEPIMGIRAKKFCFSFSFSLVDSTWRIYDARHASGNGIKNGTCLVVFLFFSAVFEGKHKLVQKSTHLNTAASPSLAPPCLRALAPLCPLNLVPSRPVSDVWLCCVWVCGS
jgi:hypothetical protein